MKLELDDNTSMTTMVVTIALCVSCIFMHGCYRVQETDNEAIKAGLHQAILPGTANARWVKP